MEKEKKYQENNNAEEARDSSFKHFIVQRTSIYHIEKIYVDDDTYYEWDRFVSTHRKRAQRNGDCLCPKEKLWQCDTICDECPFFNKLKYDSLDTPQYEGNDSHETKADYIVDPTTENFEERIIMQLTIEHLIDELNAKDPDIGSILSALYSEIKNNTFNTLSEFSKKLGENKSTFFYRVEKLKKILDERGLKK